MKTKIHSNIIDDNKETAFDVITKMVAACYTNKCPAFMPLHEGEIAVVMPVGLYNAIAPDAMKFKNSDVDGMLEAMEEAREQILREGQSDVILKKRKQH